MFEITPLQLKDYRAAQPYNMGLVALNYDSNLPLFPPAVPQIVADQNQQSNTINADIVIAGANLNDVNFIDVSKNNVVDSGGVAVINRVISPTLSNALLYNGYDVLDGGFDGF